MKGEVKENAWMWLFFRSKYTYYCSCSGVIYRVVLLPWIWSAPRPDWTDFVIAELLRDSLAVEFVLVSTQLRHSTECFFCA